MQIIKLGSNWRHSSLAITRPNGSGDYLLLIIKSSALIVIDGREYHVTPHTMLLYRKGTPQFYFAEEGDFVNDWVHFEMNDDDRNFVEKCNIPFDRPVRLTETVAVTTLFKLMSTELLLRTDCCTEFTAELMHALILKLSVSISDSEETGTPESPYAARLTALRERIYATPQDHWTVDKMCREMSVSRTHLHRLYARTFGVTCYNDVLASKMEYAKELLVKTELSVGDVSERCAFDNEVSFMRCFKKCVGMTPTQYRAGYFRREEIPEALLDCNVIAEPEKEILST